MEVWEAWTCPKVRREWVATLTPETEVDIGDFIQMSSVELKSQVATTRFQFQAFESVGSPEVETVTGEQFFQVQP